MSSEESTRAAGACVLAAFGGGVLAVVFAVSPTAGVLTVWVVGTAGVVRAVRGMSDSSATPPPLSGSPSADVYAGDTAEVARVERSPEGVMCTIHPVREEVNKP